MSSLGSWENISTSELVRLASIRGIKTLVHGREGFARLMTSVKVLLDMTHQQCPGFVMVTVSMMVGMVVGMVLLQVTGKMTSPVRSRILPSPILRPEVTSTKNPCALDDFLVVEIFINEGLRLTPVGRVESEGSAAFRPRETPLFSVSGELLRCLHHAS